MTGKPQRPPDGLRHSGRRLWRSVVDVFDIEEHEKLLLLQACRTADSLDLLQTQLDNDGPMSETSQGVRVHPALPELRQQRIVFARMLAALRVPVDDVDGSVVPGAPRGVYGIRGVGVRRRVDGAGHPPVVLQWFVGPLDFAGWVEAHDAWEAAQDAWIAAGNVWPGGVDALESLRFTVGLGLMPDEPWDQSAI